MVSPIYFGPTGQRLLKMDEVCDLVSNPSSPYWRNGSGDAAIELPRLPAGRLVLIICPHPDFGVYLKIVELDGSSRVVSTRLSCGDRSNMNEVITVSDEWYVSRGLLVSPAAAALAVREFWLTGSAGPSVEWIRPEDVGPDGNW